MVIAGIVIVALSILAAAGALRALWFGIRHFRMKQLMTGADVLEEMPSVSVCIPARNEMHALAQCLDRVIASTYPKLEIIVLDDASGDKTPTLIKAYARDGVRFVEGKPLQEGWLGKNNALQGLYREASGSYILYLDVDTYIEPGTIGQLVAYARQEKAAMVSVLPRRHDGWRASVLFSPLRYFWEIVFHHRRSPAAASNIWMIKRSVLQERGGFDATRSAIAPEAALAAFLSETNAYRYIIGTELLGVTFEKKWRSQVDTSIRLLYPLLHASWLRSIAALLGIVVITLPALALPLLLVFAYTEAAAVAAILYILWAVTYGLYLRTVWRKVWWFGALLWPVIAVQEAVLLCLSVIQYSRRQVTWKGRPVTITHS